MTVALILLLRLQAPASATLIAGEASRMSRC